MAEHEDFWLNDVRLSINPTSIQTIKSPHNFRYDLLRSAGPVHVKSGHADAQIVLPIEFVGWNDINYKLRRLLSEFTMTPFVYIDNAHVRANMQTVGNMAGCVKSLSVSTNKGDREHLTMHLVLDWFNYLPYSPSFKFIKDFPTEEKPDANQGVEAPADSALWKAWVSENMDRQHLPYPKVRPQVDLQFITFEFELRKEDPANKTDSNMASKIKQVDSSEPLEGEAGKEHDLTEVEKAREKDDTDLVNKLAEKVDGTDDPSRELERQKALEVVRKAHRGQLRTGADLQALLQEGGWRVLEGRPWYIRPPKGSKNAPEGYELFFRPRVFTFGHNFIIEGMNFNLSNHYSKLPIIGHKYATIQHMGGADKGATISCFVNGDDNLAALQAFWDSVQESVLKNRTYTRSNTMIVQNDFLNMCGLNSLVPERLETNTVSPDQTSVTMHFSYAIPDTRGELDQELALETESALLQDCMKIFENYIELTPSLWGQEGDLWVSRDRVPRWQIKQVYEQTEASSEDAVFVGEIKKKILPILNQYSFDKLEDFGEGLKTPTELFISGSGISAAAKAIATGPSPSPGMTNKIRAASFIASNKKRAADIQNRSVVGEYTVRHAQEYLKQIFTETNFDEKTLSKEALSRLEGELITQLIEGDAELRLAITNFLILHMGELEKLESVYQRAKDIGTLKGRTAYPDMYFGSLQNSDFFLSPAFYFLDEKRIHWDQGGFAALLANAKKVIKDDFDFMKGTGETTLYNWVQKSYLAEDLSPERREIVMGKIAHLEKSVEGRLSIAESLKGDGELPRINAASSENRKAITVNDNTSWCSKPDSQPENANPQTIIAKGTLTHVFTADAITDGLAVGSPQRGPTGPRTDFFPPFKPANGGEITITSPFGPRNIKGVSQFHKGMDFATGERDSSGYTDADVFCVYDGTITNVVDNGDSSRINIYHPNIGLQTIYQHMASIKNLPANLQEVFKTGKHQSIKRGDPLGKIYPHKDKDSYSSNNRGHLHFGCRIVGRSKLIAALGEDVSWFDNFTGKKSGKPDWVDPDFILNKDLAKETTKRIKGYKLGASLLEESLKSLKESIFTNNLPTMERAFPTFKLYFIEEDMFESFKFSQFDDFFNYSAVHSINIYEADNNPISTATLTLSNLSGNLSNRRFGHDMLHTYDENGQALGTRDNPEDLSSKAAGTDKENPIKSFLLQEGLKIAIKVGYSANPADLKLKFVGSVSGVEFNESTDIVTITADSYGYELVQVLKGVTAPEIKESDWLVTKAATTQNILEDMMHSPEVRHFGRWRPNGTNPTRGALTNRWEIITNPVDDNIFAPGSNYIDGGGGWIFEHLRYIIHRTTIWNIFDEMTFRHPECIACPRVYESVDGPRMTMYFGSPSQMYFSRDLGLSEIADIRAEERKKRTETIKETEDSIAEEAEHKGPITTNDRLPWNDFKWRSGKTMAERKLKTAISTLQQQKSDFLLEQGIKRRQIRPFRKYHIATSWTNIVANNIKATPDGVYNAVAVDYTEADEYNASTQSWEFDSHWHDSGTIEMKAHYSIPEHLTKTLRLSGEQILNCETEELAIRYALAALKKSMRSVYKGDLILLGNPDIDLHDIVYVVDLYSDMVGPIEVGAITTVQMKDVGYVSIIKPRMCVSSTEWASMSITDAIGYVAQGILGFGATENVPLAEGTSFAQRAAGTGADIAVGGIGLGVIAGGNPIGAALGLAAYGAIMLAGKKIIQVSQFGIPVVISPLVVHGQPLTAGLGHRYTNNGFWQRWIDKKIHWYNDGVSGLGDTWDEFWAKWNDTRLGGVGDSWFFGSTRLRE